MGSRFLQDIRHADEGIARPRWRLTSSQRDCTFRDIKRLETTGTLWNQALPPGEFWARYEKGGVQISSVQRQFTENSKRPVA